MGMDMKIDCALIDTASFSVSFLKLHSLHMANSHCLLCAVCILWENMSLAELTALHTMVHLQKQPVTSERIELYTVIGH